MLWVGQDYLMADHNRVSFDRTTSQFSRVTYWSLSFMGLALTVAGCFQPNTNPLDNEEVLLIARGGVFSAGLEKYPDPLRVDVPAAEAQELLKSLTPFDVVTTPEPSGAYDYLFVHQAGRDPLVFHVKMAGDQLIFSERRWVYQGGNSQQFQQIAEEILRSANRILPCPLVTVGVSWGDLTAPGDMGNSHAVSVRGPVLRTTSPNSPTAGVTATSKVIDDKEFYGMVVSDAKGREYVLTEVFVYGERDRVLIRAKSKIPFEMTSDDPIGLDLTWIVGGKRERGPLILEPGQYEIEVIATGDGPDVSPNDNRGTAPSKPAEDE